MTASIDMTDPAVRRLLGDAGPQPASGKRGPLMQVAGDPEHGLSSMVDLTTGKHEVLVYSPKGDVPLLTVDVYAVPGEPLKVHILCPRCRHHSTISGERKAIEFDARAVNRQRTNIIALGVAPHLVGLASHGSLSVEEFECCWELDDQATVGAFSGGNLCRWRGAIDNNLVRIA